MDGGKGSGSSSKEQTETNLKNMLSFYKMRIVILHYYKVDIKSLRSFDVNEHEFLKKDYLIMFRHLARTTIRNGFQCQ